MEVLQESMHNKLNVPIESAQEQLGYEGERQLDTAFDSKDPGWQSSIYPSKRPRADLNRDRWIQSPEC